MLHHFLPKSNWQAIGGLLRPGDLPNLQIATLTLVEDGAAEEKGEWNLAFPQSIEILGADQIKIVGTCYWQVNGDTSCELWNHSDGMRPQERAQRFTPPLRFAKNLQQSCLRFRTVVPACYIDLNLTSQGTRVDALLFNCIVDAQFEDDRWDRC